MSLEIPLSIPEILPDTSCSIFSKAPLPLDCPAKFPLSETLSHVSLINLPLLRLYRLNTDPNTSE